MNFDTSTGVFLWILQKKKFKVDFSWHISGLMLCSAGKYTFNFCVVNVPILTTWKYQNFFGFLVFWGGWLKWKHWLEMGESYWSKLQINVMFKVMNKKT